MPQINIPELPKIGRIQALELQTFWDGFFSSKEYRDNLKDRILDGKAAHMEVLLHHMTYGKPKETLALQASGDGVFVLAMDGQEVRRQVLADGMVVPAEETPALPPPAEEPDAAD